MTDSIADGGGTLKVCGWCIGDGRIGFAICQHCNGSGILDSNDEAIVPPPPDDAA